MTADKDFSYIKRELVEEIKTNNKEIRALIEATENKERIYRDFIMEFREQVQLHNVLLLGDPKTGKLGLVQNYEIMRESGAKREKYLRFGLAGIVVAAGSSIWNMIVEGFKHLK